MVGFCGVHILRRIILIQDIGIIEIVILRQEILGIEAIFFFKIDIEIEIVLIHR